ncbi:MAG TPA: DUF1707 domain-containing protein [Gemmatimonadaceae bacterium]|nr:DUF1707 domain-containing protein [Gemmatimonadaceae bacterium]
MSLEQERERAVQMLCRQFAHDNLTTAELESRLEAVYKASTLSQLQALTAGLPVVALTTDDERPHALSATATEAAQRRLLSVFGSLKKAGDWEPSPRTRVISVFSDCELDFRDARIAPGVTTIDVSAVFAAVKIIIPPGVSVECDGSAFMGSFEDKARLGPPPGGDAPILRITGVSVFSEVKVVMRMPDESALGALKREWTR